MRISVNISAMSSYPPLRAAVLTGLLTIKENLDILDSAESPYDKETTDILKRLLAPEIKEVVTIKEVQVEAKSGRGRPSKDVRLSEEDQEKLTKEIRSLIDDLNNMGTGDTTLPTGERIQITKAKTNLVDQLLKMRERNVTAQKMEAFQETVIEILDAVVDEEGRELFLKKMEPYR